MAYIIVDTDVSSKILRDRLPASLEAKLVGKILCTTFVTLAELTQWAEIRQWGSRNRQALDRWLGQIPGLPDSEGIGDGVLDFEDFAEYEGLTVVSA